MYYSGQTLFQSGFARLLTTPSFTVSFRSYSPQPLAPASGLPTWLLMWERWPHATSLMITGNFDQWFHINKPNNMTGCLANEQYLRTLLPSLELTVKGDLGVDLADLTDPTRELIVVCAEAFYNIQPIFSTITAPVIVLGLLTSPETGLVSAISQGDTDYLYPDIIDPTHPLAAGLPAGVTVPSSVFWYDWTLVSPDAQVVAAAFNGTTTNTSRASIYMYETGATMLSGQVASGRRIFLPSPWFVPAAQRYVEDQQLFMAAVHTAMRTARLETSLPAVVSDSMMLSLNVSICSTRSMTVLTSDSSSYVNVTVLGNASIVGNSGNAPVINGLAQLTNLRLQLAPGLNSATIQLRAACDPRQTCYWATSPSLVLQRAGYGAISTDSFVTGLNLGSELSTVFDFTVTAVDVYGFRRLTGGDQVSATLITPSGASSPLPLRDEGNGNYSTSFTPGDGGQMSVTVSVGPAPGAQIRTSPFPVNVLVRCTVGQYAKTPLGPCEICLLGFYRSANDSQDACLACPTGTTTYQGSASSIELCMCAPTFFSPRNETGVPCVPCPPGGVCPGQLAKPYAAPGFYPGDNGVFIECTDDRSTCLGGANFACRKGHTGRMCSTCSKGYYKVNRICRVCQAGNKSLIALAVVVSIVLLGLLAVFNANSSNSVKYTTLSIAFNSLQIAALYGQFDLTWPTLVNSVFAVFSAFNFNIDLLAPECSFGANNAFLMKWFLKMLLPIYFALVYGLLYAVFVLPQRLFVAAFGERVRASWSCLTADPPGPRESWTSLATARHTLGRMFWDPINIRLAQHTFVRCWWQLMSLAYLPLVAAALSFINCHKYSDGRTTLVIDKTVPCSGWWYGMLPIALAFIVAYCAIFPLAVVLMLRYKRNKMDPLKFYVRYGFLVARYVEAYYWWELKIMLRKFGVVVAMLFVTRYAEMQGTCAALVLILSLADHHNTHPYRAYIHNVLETFCVACSILVLMFGVAFQSRAASGRSATGVILAIIIINILVLLCVFGYDLFVTRKTERRLRGETEFSDQVAMTEAPVSGSFSGGENVAPGGRRPVASLSDVNSTEPKAPLSSVSSVHADLELETTVYRPASLRSNYDSCSTAQHSADSGAPATLTRPARPANIHVPPHADTVDWT